MGSLRGVWGLRPQLGVSPLYPVLSLVTIAIVTFEVTFHGITRGCGFQASDFNIHTRYRDIASCAMIGTEILKIVKMSVALENLQHPSALKRMTWQWRGHGIQYTVQDGRQNAQQNSDLSDLDDPPSLVLLHGFGAAIGHWRNNIPALAAAGYRVYALDLLGFGASDKPQLDYSLELWQDLVQDFWAAHIGEPVVWVGNSIGALLSLMLAADNPDITKGAVLLNCAGGLNHRPEELNPPLRFVMGMFTRLVSSPIVGGFLFDRIRQKSRIRATLRQVYRNTAAITDELVDILYTPACDPGAQQVFASILTAPPGVPPRDLLPHVQCPLLVLWGEADPWTPISGAAPFRNHTASPIKVVPIPDTGHCPHDERPEVVNPLLVDWLHTLRNIG